MPSIWIPVNDSECRGNKNDFIYLREKFAALLLQSQIVLFVRKEASFFENIYVLHQIYMTKMYKCISILTVIYAGA